MSVHITWHFNTYSSTARQQLTSNSAGMASISWWYVVCTERKVAVVTTVGEVPSLKEQILQIPSDFCYLSS